MSSTPYLPELLRIMEELRRLGLSEEHDQPLLQRVLSRNLLEGRFFDFSDVRWLVLLGLVESGDGRFKLTDVGDYLLQLSETGDVYPSESQIVAFIECLFSNKGPLRKTLSDFFLLFRISPEGETFRARIADIPFESNERSVGELLVQLSILSTASGWYVVNRAHTEKVQSVRALARGISREDLEAILRHRREMGEAAERICLKFEKQRLARMGKAVHAELVEHTSKLDVSAGYDISSFDGTSDVLEHDRFIEVKSSASSQLSFYWPRNEIAVARELRAMYWIYFFRGFRMSGGFQTLVPEMFQDPIRSILSDSRFSIEEEILHVTEVTPT